MAHSANAVKLEILNAFAATPYPGDENLVVAQTGCDPECLQIAAAFQGKHWNEISLQMLRENSEALPLFTPQAFRYYLPAYMIGCLDAYYEVDVVKDYVVFNLTPPDTQRGGFAARATQFNAEERQAIKSFLELMKQYRVADWASAGLKPPPNGIDRAIDFWASSTR